MNDIRANRRDFLRASTAMLAASSLTLPTIASAQDQIRDVAPQAQGLADTVTWVSTTRDKPWQNLSGVQVITLTRLRRPGPYTVADFNVIISPQQTFQTIEGFGACFHEKGWQALGALKPADRDHLMYDLFAPGAGANFNICRVPIGANDFALDWYSYNEMPGDFTMANFSIARDRKLLIPFIKAAQKLQPGLSLWGSPWSPPSWMKTNGYYATSRPMLNLPDNGIRDDQIRKEGEDTFIQDERYFKAYALYFRRFVEDYRKQGLNMAMVMPQNEFNSAQIFPSCTWTPEGLARFLPYLGTEMAKTGTDIFLGTLERADETLFERIYADPKAGPLIKGVGAQWAGRGAVPYIHRAHPGLKIYQTEQECGDGRNDWRFARFSWQMMKDFLRAGANVYDYWNIALGMDAKSSWGWSQNSLISVDFKTGDYRLNHDYYVLKHLSHFVKPGAKRIATLSFSGYENLLAFANPDGKIVVVAHNDMAEPTPIHLTLGDKTLRAVMAADSFNTFVI